MVFGYARVSTNTQSIERQVRNIRKLYPNANVYQEAYTGTKLQGRKELDRLLHIVRQGDTIVFDSASRMSRNVTDAMKLYQELFEKGIELEFIKEPHINTATYRQALNKQIKATIDTGNNATDTFVNSIIQALNKYTVDLATEQVRLCFGQAEKEVMDLRQRTREGIETARRNGKQIGTVEGATLTTKKSIDIKDKMLKSCIAFGGNLTDKEFMDMSHIARNTFYKYKRELLANE